ncbi:MAG: glycosyltransferase [Anaerolineae bacterium]|nr:glycosyltransferase [Anaerolineae bacterium]
MPNNTGLSQGNPMSKSPLVTVITPTYNHANYLPEAIESVLSQDYPNIEYIVLDDGSTDGTRQVLEQYTGRLVWESHSNMGEARTVNKGWQMARGEFVFTLSSDDLMLPGLIDTSVKTMLLYPEALVTYPDWIVIDQLSRQVGYDPVPEFSYANMVRWHMCFPGPGSCIRRRAFALEPMRDPSLRFVGDFDYFLRLGLHGLFVHIPQTLAAWREHPSSITVSEQGAVMAEEHIRILNNLYQQANLPKDILRIRNEAYSAAYYVVGTGLSGKAARQCYWKSINLHLSSRPFGKPRSWKVMLATFVMPACIVQNILRRRHQRKRERAAQDISNVIKI